MRNMINSFQSISLKEMDKVALLKRTDTKFLIHKKDIITVLKEIKGFYKVLEIDKVRLMTYKTMYFDTEQKDFFNDHHNGKAYRKKIRIRKYMETNSCFLEIKQKDGKGKTDKSRISIPDFEIDLSKRSIDFIRKKTLEDYILSPTIQNQFNRITLVNNKDRERVTIDLNLKMKKNRIQKLFRNLVIIEVKQKDFNRNSAIVKALKRHRFHPDRISKYCIGMVCMYEDLKYNEFKEKLLKIKKLDVEPDLYSTKHKINPAVPVGA